MKHSPRLPVALLCFTALVTLWSLIQPHDMFTWFLEAFPVLLGAPLLITTYKRFRLTNLLYILICIHGCILLVGAHYTYAEVPLFNWLKEVAHLQRNHYDRVGHFAQGFVPAMIARELLLRHKVVKLDGWLNFIVVCICLAISAVYELIEWAVAVFSGTAAEAFLGTQGDVWDTQTDMFMALIGACTALLVLGRLHQKFVNKI